MAEIGIIGAGIGGLTAGMKLAEKGHRVSIFERSAEEGMAYPWMDDIRFDVFEYCAVEPPPEDCYFNKDKSFFISPDGENSFRVPFLPPMVEISIDRQALAKHLVSLARKAGCRLCFESNVESLLIESEAVKGLVVDGKERRFDLVIDSSGLRSPFRAQLPEKYGVEAQLSDNDVMFTWRGSFRRKEEAAPPERPRSIYIKHLGGRGLSWCHLNQRGEVDVLIARTGGLSAEEKDEAVADILAGHDFASDELLRPGLFAEIPLRSTLSAMVADGYAAIGDAAFMTMPMMGSGIEASMKAGLWLSELIEKYRPFNFTAAELWEYQVKYYKELGARYSFVDVVKNWLLGIDTELLNWLFGCGAVTDEDMGMVSTDNFSKKEINPFDLLKRAGIMLKRPEIVAQAAKWMSIAARKRLLANSIPSEYDEKKIAAWQRRYEE